MNKVIKGITKLLLPIMLCLTFRGTVYASDGQDYITISVEAEDDNGETLLYALDTDEPSAFTTSNTFSVPAGTNHTIYVKDAAGNITSQEYVTSESDYDKAYQQGADDEGRTVNIDVILDDEEPASEYSDYEYAGDLTYDPYKPAENGQGTVYDKVETQINDNNAERLFYTVTTDDGEVFYLVIDQGQSNNNVYLLDQVKMSDLSALAVQDKEKEDSGSTSLLSTLNEEKEGTGEEKLLTEDEEPDAGKKKAGSSSGSTILLLFLIAAGGGIYYYIKVYRNKRDEQMDLIDAPDKEDFAVEEEEEDADFGLDEDYQEQAMAMLLDEDYHTAVDDSPKQAKADEPEDDIYAMSHKQDTSVDTEMNNKENYEEFDEEYDEDFDEELDAPDEEEEE